MTYVVLILLETVPYLVAWTSKYVEIGSSYFISKKLRNTSAFPAFDIYDHVVFLMKPNRFMVNPGKFDSCSSSWCKFVRV